MWVILRRALCCAGALSVLAACSGSHSNAPTTGSTLPSSGSASRGSTPAQPSGGSSSASAPPTSPGSTVPPPVSGNISQTVPSGTEAPLPPVGLADPARFGKAALIAAIADPARVHASAHIPGEIAGPALSFTLQLTNRGRAGLDLGTNVAVTAQDGAGVPFSALTTSTHPVSGTLRPGAHTSGSYVFHLPANTKNPVTIAVTYAATSEVATFVGPVS